jgi:membrane associated rhomboid family serine protease
MSGRRSSRGTSGSPTKSRKPAGPGDWFSLIFLIVMSAVYLGMFLFSLSLNDWKIAPMSENPWYGPSAEALIDAGAIVLPLMNAPGNQWWRLFSSVFLPAGMIQMFVCSALLWMFGYPARKSLPLPQASVAGVFIVSSLVGSLTSSNLNGKYVSCGAFSGVMSLMAVFCVDQMLSWPRNRLFNLKEWWLIAMVMVSLVGGILVISLFPLVDIWFSLGGFISGMLIAFILVIMPRVRSQAFGSRKKLLWIQALSGVALLGLIIAASVGLAITPKLGESIEVLSQISCVQMSSDMECTPYGFLSKGGCGLQWVHESSAVAVACPAVSADSSGYQYFPTNATFADIGNDAITETECQRYCDGRSDPINIIAVPPASTVTADEVVDELNQNAEGSADAESVAAQASLLAPAVAPSTPAPVNVDPLTTIAQPVATQPVATQPTNDPQQVSAMNQPLMGTGAADGAATQSAPLDPAVTIPSPISNPLPSPTSTNAGGLNPWGRGSTTTTPATSSTTTPTSIPAPANAGPVDIGISNQALGAVDTPQSPTTTFQSPTTFPAPPAPLFG